MKTLLTLLAALALTLSASAKDGWLDNLEKAKTQAKSENKNILIDFTGSDWCGWCKKLDAEIFKQKEWKDYASKKLVLMEADFPQMKKLPRATQKQNEALAAQYKIQGYPTLILITPDGKQIGKFGYTEGGPSALIAQIDKAK